MKILVINSGSSSIKYQLFAMPFTAPVCSGLVERIGQHTSCIIHKIYPGGVEKVVEDAISIRDHESGMVEVVRLLTAPGIGVIQNPGEIDVIGHRIVHGGKNLVNTTIITPFVKKEIKRLFSLSPLHNPGNYQGIEVAERIFNKAVQVAVFDTAFHQTMPEKAFRYAIPDNFYADHAIRVYGFHGTSHKYVADKALKYLDNPGAKIITIHLGNGCSMAAIKDGKCMDTSMGLTPLDGLIMGTRCGNIDASVIIYLTAQLGYTTDQLNQLLNKQSGMLGLTGYSDMRDIRKLIESGDRMAQLAYDMYAYRIKKYIGAYTAALNGLDAIVFTAGVGENDSLMWQMVCQDMDFFGLRIDPASIALKKEGIRELNVESSPAKILVIPTNEELEIANQCVALLKKN